MNAARLLLMLLAAGACFSPAEPCPRADAPGADSLVIRRDTTWVLASDSVTAIGRVHVTLACVKRERKRRMPLPLPPGPVRH